MVLYCSCSGRKDDEYLEYRSTTFKPPLGTMEDMTIGYRQKARQLVRLVYAEIKKLPADERYTLGDQIHLAGGV